MGAIAQRAISLRPYEILVLIIVFVLLGICLTVIPLVGENVERSFRAEARDARGAIAAESR